MLLGAWLAGSAGARMAGNVSLRVPGLMLTAVDAVWIADIAVTLPATVSVAANGHRSRPENWKESSGIRCRLITESL